MSRAYHRVMRLKGVKLDIARVPRAWTPGKAITM
jgi:hypothetical protein